MYPLELTDEGRHPPDSEQPGWEEAWDLDFTTADGSLGGYVRLALRPARRQAWFWAALVGQGRPLVTVVDHEVVLPRGTELDLRAEGLWTSLTCETPLEHWSVGLEAFGVALDDPTEAWRSLRGDRTALGLDLEWETAGLPSTAPHPHGYHLPCLVHGEVLVGDEVIAFDGSGGRSHTWGHRRWDRAWSTTAGRLDDGTTWYVHRPGILPAQGASGLPGPGRVEVDPARGTDRLELSMTPLHHAPVGLGAVDGGQPGSPARSVATPPLTAGGEWGGESGTSQVSLGKETDGECLTTADKVCKIRTYVGSGGPPG